MIINFDSLMTNMDGSTTTEEGAPVKMSAFVMNALLSSNLEQNLSGTDKFKRAQLAEKVYKGGDVELNAEDLSLIKTVVGLYYTPLVVLRIFNHIESVGTKPEI